jgi:endo-1,4-beta-xylanase
VWTTLDRLGGLGYPLHITEYIPQSGGKPITGGWREGTWTEEAQAEFAEQFYRLCFGHPAVASINWWGLSDRQIWLPAGGLIDKEYEPKPVYNRLRDLIHRQWKTGLDVQTDEKGQATFRGFCGAYDVTVKLPDGRVRTFKAALQRGRDNQLTFTVE